MDCNLAFTIWLVQIRRNKKGIYKFFNNPVLKEFNRGPAKRIEVCSRKVVAYGTTKAVYLFPTSTDLLLHVR